jgi:hypothetical protein
MYPVRRVLCFTALSERETPIFTKPVKHPKKLNLIYLPKPENAMANEKELSRETMVVTAVNLSMDGRALVSVGRMPQGFVAAPAGYQPSPVGSMGQPFAVNKEQAPQIGDEVEVVILRK